jgi:hypothetical protein
VYYRICYYYVLLIIAYISRRSRKPFNGPEKPKDSLSTLLSHVGQPSGSHCDNIRTLDQTKGVA